MGLGIVSFMPRATRDLVDRLSDVASNADKLAGELANPSPDHVMRRTYLRQLEESLSKLTYDERRALRGRTPN